MGQSVVKVFDKEPYRVTGTYFHHSRPNLIELDATDPVKIAEVFVRTEPSVVINAAGMSGGMDVCQTDPDRGRQFFLGVPQNLAKMCRNTSCRLVHISTQAIFDGRDGPYSEEDVPNPISILGQVKLDAENYIESELDDALILRTTFVFGWDPLTETPNFLMQLIRSLKNGDSFVAPTDQISNPILADNFADALMELVEKRARGVFNLAGDTLCSKYEWAIKASELFGLPGSRIVGATSLEMGQSATRPLRAGLITEKAKNYLKTPLLNLTEALESMDRQMDIDRCSR